MEPVPSWLFPVATKEISNLQKYSISYYKHYRQTFNGEEANATKDAILENSDFLNGY